MATSAGEIEVKLTLTADQFKQAMGESQNQLSGFGNVLDEFGAKLLATFSFAAIAEFFKSSIEAYAEQQLAVTKLTAALGAHGIASEQLVTHLDQQAMALEALTGIQAVSITNVQTLLTEYGLQGPVLDQATRATTTLASGLGIDLNRAAMLVAKAFDGNVTMLKRYGIQIDQTVPPAQQFANLLDQIQGRFGAVAVAQAGTFTGQMTSLGNSFTHLEEAIGKLLSGPAGSILSWFKGVIDSITTAVQWVIQVKDVSGSFLATLGGVILVTIRGELLLIVNILDGIVTAASKIPIIGSQFNTLKGEIDSTRQAINSLSSSAQTSYLAAVSNNQVILQNEKEKQTAFVNTAQKHMDVDAAMNAWIANQSMKNQQQFMQSLKDEETGFTNFANVFIVTSQQMWGEMASLGNKFFSGVGNSFASMITQGKSFSDSMKAVFREMTQQLISYVTEVILKMIVLLTLETMLGIPVAGGAMGGINQFITGHMATGGVISEPSIILGLQSGTRTLAGEAGPEMVSPMNGGNSGGGGQGGGGGNITVNISGQFLEGDSNSWNRLVREQIIPQIRRYTMSNPTGPFNRTRGAA